MRKKPNSGLVKFSTLLAIIVMVLVVAGAIVTFRAPNPAFAPVSAVNYRSPSSEDSLGMISTSSPLEADMDAYVRSSGSIPDPNDLNDSYADLNR